ncbi:MAG: aldo/keto reductase [Actinomycetota bacterium]
MKYREYGKTGLKVSEICFGTMRYAPKEKKNNEQTKKAKRALEEAVDLGINFIHSSYEYGTRWLTGEVLRQHPKRHDLHHIVKINVPDWGQEDFDAKIFRTRVEEALRSLGVERIAIVQHLHRGSLDPELGYRAEGEPKRLSEFDAVTEPLVEVFEKMKQEGKVMHLATFPYTVGYGRRVVKSGKFSGIVAYFNALETEILDIFPDMQKQGMGFIGIRPLAAGLLTDRRIDRSSLPKDDRMKDAQWDRLYDQLGELRKELPQEPDSWTKFSIRFALAHPLVASTVIGINKPEHLHTAVEAIEEKYPEDEVLQTAHRICKNFREKYGVKGNMAGIPVY